MLAPIGSMQIYELSHVCATGKTTLLQLVAGKYMVGRDSIRVLGQSPFYDMVRRAATLVQRPSAVFGAAPHFLRNCSEPAAIPAAILLAIASS